MEVAHDAPQSSLYGEAKLTVLLVIGQRRLRQWRMQRPEVRASNSSFFARFSIDELTSGLDLSAKIGIADRLLGHEIDAAGEEALELLGEIEVSACVGCIGLPVSHVDEEVEIARRFEVI